MTTVHIDTIERRVPAPRIAIETQWQEREYPRGGTDGVIRMTTIHGVRVATLVTVQQEGK
jgi:hypothetical protein